MSSRINHKLKMRGRIRSDSVGCALVLAISFIFASSCNFAKSIYKETGNLASKISGSKSAKEVPEEETGTESSDESRIVPNLDQKQESQGNAAPASDSKQTTSAPATEPARFGSVRVKFSHPEGKMYPILVPSEKGERRVTHLIDFDGLLLSPTSARIVEQNFKSFAWDPQNGKGYAAKCDPYFYEVSRDGSLSSIALDRYVGNICFVALDRRDSSYWLISDTTIARYDSATQLLRQIAKPHPDTYAYVFDEKSGNLVGFAGSKGKLLGMYEMNENGVLVKAVEFDKPIDFFPGESMIQATRNKNSYSLVIFDPPPFTAADMRVVSVSDSGNVRGSATLHPDLFPATFEKSRCSKPSTYASGYINEAAAKKGQVLTYVLSTQFAAPLATGSVAPNQVNIKIDENGNPVVSNSSDTASNGTTVTVHIEEPQNGQPARTVAMVLASFDKITWNILNPGNVPIQTIILSSDYNSQVFVNGQAKEIKPERLGFAVGFETSQNSPATGFESFIRAVRKKISEVKILDTEHVFQACTHANSFTILNERSLELLKAEAMK